MKKFFSFYGKSICSVLASFLISYSTFADVEALPVVAFWQFSDDAPYADSSGNGQDLNILTRKILVKNNFAHFPSETTGQIGRDLNFQDYSALTIEFFVRMNDFTKEKMALYTFFGWNAESGFFWSLCRQKLQLRS